MPRSATTYTRAICRPHLGAHRTPVAVEQHGEDRLPQVRTMILARQDYFGTIIIFPQPCVGYIVGLNIGVVVTAGGIISWWEGWQRS
jgi:hypothetical protein